MIGIDMKIELVKTRKVLPPGAITQISKMTQTDQGYVSRFFQGKIEVTHDNEKLIDAAIKILEEVVERETKLSNKLNSAVNNLLSNSKA